MSPPPMWLNNRREKAVLWAGVVIFLVPIFSLAQAKEIRYDTPNKRDPFQPLMGPHAFQGGMGRGGGTSSLEGIVFDPKKGSYVVMGGAIYREGDSVDGAKLIKVLPDRVVLLQESEEVVIWLREEILEAGQKEGEGA